MFGFQGTPYLFVSICFNHKQLPIPFGWIMLPCSEDDGLGRQHHINSLIAALGGCHSEFLWPPDICCLKMLVPQVSMFGSLGMSEFYRTWLLRYMPLLKPLTCPQYFVKHHLQCKKHLYLLVWVVVAFQFFVSLLMLKLFQAGFLPVTIGVQPPLLGLEPQLPMI